MNNDFFYKDIEKRANDMFNNWYSTWAGIKDKHFEMSIKQEESAFGGRSYVENGVLKMVIFTGTVDNYLSVINNVMNLRTSLSINSIHQGDDNLIDLISAEGIIYPNGVPEVFDSKVIDQHITNLIMTFVNRFVICHEFGHLFSGHYEQFKMIKMRFIPMHMTGDEWSIVPDEKKLDVFTMEWDADRFAATDSVRELLFLWENYDTQVQYRNLIGKNELFFWWGFAVALIFHWINEMDCYKMYKQEILYNPRDRMMNILSTALDCLDKLFGKNIPELPIKEMSANIAKGALNAEEIFSVFRNGESVWIKEQIDMTNSSLPMIENNWERLKEILKKDAFIDLD